MNGEAWYRDVLSLRSDLKWYRSWPKAPPSGRAYVMDSLPRLIMSGCDYNSVEGGLPDDEPGFLLLEWDVALDIQERTTFAELAQRNPAKPLVAQYIKNFGGAVRGIQRRMGYSSINRGAMVADYFGLGCIYLPRWVIVEFLATKPAKFTDRELSHWYRDNYGPVDVTWEVHPQHLHGD